MTLPTWQLPFTVFSIISITVYVLIIGRMACTRKHGRVFRGSFFKLIKSQAVAEWLLFLEFLVLYKARKFGYLDVFFRVESDAWVYVPRFSTFVHYYLKIVIYFGQCFVSVNRLTAISWPLSYEKMWTSKLIWFLRLSQYLIPFVFTVPVAFNSEFHIYYEYNSVQKALRLETDDVSTNIISYIDGSLCLTASVVCTVSYTVTLVKASKDLSKYGSDKRKTIEMKLLFCGISLFLILLLNTAAQTMTCIGTLFSTNALVLLTHDVSYPLIELMYSMTPWILLLSSTAVQELIFPCIGPKTAVLPNPFFIVSKTCTLKSHELSPQLPGGAVKEK